MKRSYRELFILILGVTFSGFIFSLHYTNGRHAKELSQLVLDNIQLINSDKKGSEVTPSSVPSTSQMVLSLSPREIQTKSSKDCECISKKTGKTHNFCYVDPQNSQATGRKFDCEHLEILEKLDLVDNPGPFVDLSDSMKNEQDVVFCSAISDNHFNEGMTSYEALKKFYPKRKYILYGLNLSPLNANHFKSLINVEYRDFNTSGYPSYVNKWMTYRFKPLILAEVMKEHPNIWWMDAHIVVKKPNMTTLLFEELSEKLNQTLLPSPIVFFIHASHSNFATMFPELLNYFPSNSIALLKNEQHGSQLGANTFYVARTEYTVHIFKWWVLCALDQTCMSPPGAQVYCRFSKNRFDVFANCYRAHFDNMDLSNIKPPDSLEFKVLSLKPPYLVSTKKPEFGQSFSFESNMDETSLEQVDSGAPIFKLLESTEKRKRWPFRTNESTDCNCESKKTGKFYNFCYVDPQNLTSIGRKFSCEHLEYMERLELLTAPTAPVNLSDSAKIEQDIVFCSAISDNHFSEGYRSIKNFRKHNPTRKFILYGLNLSAQLAEKIRRDHNVEVRPFDTSGYPKFVNLWLTYRFKPLILAELLREYSNIWWIDAHLTPKQNNMTGILSKEIARRRLQKTLPSSIIFLIFTGHGNFPVMIPELLTFFPSNSIALLKNEKIGWQLGANTFYIAKTEYTVKIFKWWVLCALDEHCMSPNGSKVRCNIDEEDRFTKFANCFRYDQSVINLLLLNDFQDHHKYFTNIEHLF